MEISNWYIRDNRLCGDIRHSGISTFVRGKIAVFKDNNFGLVISDDQFDEILETFGDGRNVEKKCYKRLWVAPLSGKFDRYFYKSENDAVSALKKVVKELEKTRT